jgi:REP element-mobilizing transposase RayT
MYYIVCPCKYRKVVISEEVDKTIKEICEEISKRYEIRFLEIGTEENHAHFLIQSVSAYSLAKIVARIESITEKEIFKKHPEVKEQL